LKVLSLILAGGSGEELGALTRHRAKTAIPFGGGYRIIDFCLSNCVNSGITDIYVMAQFNPKSLIDHIGMGKPWDLDRKAGGIYIMQPSYNGRFAHWYRGTGDALWQNIEVIRDSDSDLVLVLSGDQVYTMDYRKMIERHRESGKPVTLACKEVSPSESRRLGMIKCDGNGIIEDLKEKPLSSDYRHASLGVYVFDREFLLGNLNKDTADLVFDMIIPNIELRNAAGYFFDSYWEDIGSLPAYYKASMRLLDDRSFMMIKNRPVFSREPGMAPTRFSNESSVRHSIVSDGCIIKGRVKDSILFPGVRVEEGASVEESIIFSYSRVKEEAVVEGAILDKLVEVGEGSSVGERIPDSGKENISDPQPASPRITVLGKGASVSDEVKVSAGAMIEPGEEVRGERRS